MPSVSRRVVPVAACRCPPATGLGSWASAPSGRSAAHQRTCRRCLPHLYCASLAPTLPSDSHARPLLPSTALRPPGVRDWLSPHVLRPLGRRPSGLHPSLRCPSSVRSVSSAAWLARDYRSTGLFHRSGLRQRAAAYYALG